MLSYIRYIYSVFLICVLCGCENIISESDNSLEEGVVSLSVGGGGDSQHQELLESLKFSIQHPNGTVLREWNSISELPSEIRAYSGFYVFLACSRDISGYPRFGEYFYSGKTLFELTAPEHINVKVDVGIGSTMASVFFDHSSFSEAYSSYRVDLRTTSSGNMDSEWLEYGLDTEGMEGCFVPGTLRFRLFVTSREDGTEYEFYPNSIANCLAGESREITLRVNLQSSYHTLVVSTDDGYHSEEELNLMLPGTALPNLPPTLRCNGFESGGVVSNTMGYREFLDCSLVAHSLDGYSSLVLGVESEEIVGQLGGRNSIELVGISEGDKEVLNSNGIRWSPEFSDAVVAAEYIGRVDVCFDELFEVQTIEPNGDRKQWGFSLMATDTLGLGATIEGSSINQINFTAELCKPVFGIIDHGEGNYWSYHNEFEIYAHTNSALKPILWRETTTGGWEVVSQFDFGEQQKNDKDTIVTNITGLIPNTDYNYKLTMGDHQTETFGGTTENPQTIPNGGMEDWLVENYSVLYGFFKTRYFWDYEPYANASVAHWTSNNARTTSERGWGTTYDESWPAVSQSSKSTAHSGNYAAEIRTTSASDLDAQYSATPGMLYIGTFEYKQATDFRQDGINYGQPYNSRPKSFSFYYTYEPYDNSESCTAQIIVYNGNNVIGYGRFNSPSGTDILSYTLQTVAVEYSNRKLPATSISIVFESTNINPAPFRNRSHTIYSGTETRTGDVNVGAIMRIDEVTLNYI